MVHFKPHLIQSIGAASEGTHVGHPVTAIEEGIVPFQICHLGSHPSVCLQSHANFPPSSEETIRIPTKLNQVLLEDLK